MLKNIAASFLLVSIFILSLTGCTSRLGSSLAGISSSASLGGPSGSSSPTPTPAPGATPTPTATPAPTGGTHTGTITPPGADVGLPPSNLPITPTGQVWYVRPDGGTATQCNGKADAGYPNNGSSNQACAFSNPTYLWANDVAGETAHWKIAGGDSVIVRGGPYRIGYKNNSGASTDAWGFCQGNNNGCMPPPVPSGTAGQHTKILGENYGSCTAKTQLHGGYGLSAVLDLSGSQHVDVACLEITDWANCSRVGIGNVCAKGFPGWADYADNGINTDGNTSDVSFIDLDVHGLTTGIAGPIGGVITVDHVRLHANGSSDWNFDNGSPMANPAAQVNASYLFIEFSGCTEEYPIVSQIPIGVCYDQQAGGWAYGDGVGTPSTSLLNFTCDHCSFNHNTQDGFDLLHTTGSVISITNSMSFANEGQQFKLGPMAQVTFKDNIVIGNCHRMAAPISGGTPNYFSGLSDNGSDLTNSRGLCRADGTPLSINMGSTGTYTFENNTVVSYGDIQWGLTCIDVNSGNAADCSNANITYQNNISVAYSYPSGIFPKNPVSLYFEEGSPGSGFKKRSNNLFYNFRSSICPTGFNNETCTSDPLFVSAPDPLASYSDDTIFDNMNLHLQSSSPAKGTGISIPDLTLNYEGNPFTNPPNMGAY